MIEKYVFVLILNIIYLPTKSLAFLGRDFVGKCEDASRIT